MFLGFGCFASSAKVGRKSQKAPAYAEVLPAFTLPGHQAIIGSRIPPSYRSLFIPRSEPLLLKYSGSFPPSLCGPLSLEKSTNVFLSIFSSRNFCNTSPTYASNRLTIAAYAARGYACGAYPFPVQAVILTGCSLNSFLYFSNRLSLG